MGNTNSTPSSQSQSLNDNGSNNGNIKFKTQIIDLDGKLLVDVKNRNIKKLKPQLFYSLFDTVEIVPADALSNSEYMKNKTNLNPTIITTTLLLDNDKVNSSSSTTTTTTTTTTSTSSSQQDDQQQQQVDTNNSFENSSPVPSPSSSLTKKFVNSLQINPDMNLEETMKTTLSIEIQSENNSDKQGEDLITISKENIPISHNNHHSQEFKTSPTQQQQLQIVDNGQHKRANSDLENKPKSTVKIGSTSLNSSSPVPNGKQKGGKKSNGSPSNGGSGNSSKQPSLDELLSLKNKYNIHSVDFSINRLDDIQDEVLKIISHFNVQELNLSTNFFAVLPDLHIIKSLTNLNLARNKLTKIPMDIFSGLPSLAILNLDKNHISSLPDDIDKIKSLKYLSIRSNSIDSLPNSFCNLTNLLSLDLSHNKLKSLPNQFDNLVNLRMLWITNNIITSIPSMKKLTNLSLLDISSNRLTSISKEFALLAPKAKELNGCDRTEYELIEGGGLGSLKEMNIRDNRELVTLPLEFKSVESTLTLLTSIPTEIIPKVYLGGLDSANNSQILQNLGITHIVLAIGDLSPFFPKIFKYYTIDDARDTPQYDLSIHFDQTNSFIEQGRKNGGGVLIHCRAGISRSSTLVISYLMKYHNMSYKKAASFVQSKRPQIQPNSGFKDQLIKYEAKLLCLDGR